MQESLFIQQSERCIEIGPGLACTVRQKWARVPCMNGLPGAWVRWDCCGCVNERHRAEPPAIQIQTDKCAPQFDPELNHQQFLMFCLLNESCEWVEIKNFGSWIVGHPFWAGTPTSVVVNPAQWDTKDDVISLVWYYLLEVMSRLQNRMLFVWDPIAFHWTGLHCVQGLDMHTTHPSQVVPLLPRSGKLECIVLRRDSNDVYWSSSTGVPPLSLRKTVMVSCSCIIVVAVTGWGSFQDHPFHCQHFQI